MGSHASMDWFELIQLKTTAKAQHKQAIKSYHAKILRLEIFGGVRQIVLRPKFDEFCEPWWAWMAGYIFLSLSLSLSLTHAHIHIALQTHSHAHAYYLSHVPLLSLHSSLSVQINSRIVQDCVRECAWVCVRVCAWAWVYVSVSERKRKSGWLKREKKLVSVVYHSWQMSKLKANPSSSGVLHKSTKSSNLATSGFIFPNSPPSHPHQWQLQTDFHFRRFDCNYFSEAQLRQV